MMGRRLQAGNLDDVQSGDYWRASDANPAMPDGYWIVALPIERDDPILGMLNPSSHTITEHDDGTITVAPSIRVVAPDDSEVYHGWLERGVWRSA